jgi:hypothetical protein
MHDSKLVLKSGEMQIMPVYKWRPKEGWVQLFNYDPVNLVDIESGYIGGWDRKLEDDGTVSPVSVDILEQAKEDGWDGT